MILYIPIAGFFLGMGLRILYDAPPKKRSRYVWKVIAFSIGFFGGYLGIAFLNELVAHHARRKAFEAWKEKRTTV